MTALKDFEARIGEVSTLLDRVAPGWAPTEAAPTSEGPPLSELPVGVLARSSLVLLVSYFEGFLKDLTDEAFDRILADRVPCHRLTQAIRGQAVMRHVRLLRTSHNTGEVWEAVTQLGLLGNALNGKDAVTASLLPRDETKRDVTSIDPHKINTLLRALGDLDLNSGPMSKYADRLRGLKQIRDNAVHGNEQDLPSLGFADVTDAHDLLQQCAGDLDRRVNELLAGLLVSLTENAPA